MAAPLRAIRKLKQCLLQITHYSRLQRSFHLVYNINNVVVSNQKHLSTPYYSFSQRFLTTDESCRQQQDDRLSTSNSNNDTRLDKVEFNRRKQKEKLEKKRARKLAFAKKSQEKAHAAVEKLYYAEYCGQTTKGEKKDVTSNLYKTYSPNYVESSWYNWWEKKGYFQANASQFSSCFTMCLPPPNVTGNLHLGHALTNSIQDAIVRWRRMHGDKVLWNPGCDHAGIATQVIVEKQLMKDSGLTRHDIGRHEFIQEVWKWKKEKGDNIYAQMRKLGSSLDWDRACFTMDPSYSASVVEAFVQLYDRGLIYRSNRLVNWSCTLKSAISDIEVEDMVINNRTKLHVPGYTDKIEFGTISSFAYKLLDSDEEIVVATTRIETMLGDTAIAVHPNDNRYKHFQGKYAVHPFCNRKLPIIVDSFVDQSLGSGAVKVTPAHSHIDYDIGKKHNLPFVSILDDSGVINDVCTQFQGLKRFDARREISDALKELGLHRGTEDHSMTLPICSRSRDIIEPVLKDQWFVSCANMMRKACRVVTDGHLKLIPSYHNNIWEEWLRNEQDWCISRQLWWGHQIPAYRVYDVDDQTIFDSSGEEIWVCGRNLVEASMAAVKKTGLPAENIKLVQDEDVLDTWFSSAIFPLAVFGWPQQTSDLDEFYPTSLLETGSDILFFWVARMVMLCLELHGELPFKKVLLHGLLRDSCGRKMSKSLGNVIDPIDVIHGATIEVLAARLRESNISDTEIEGAMIEQQKQFPCGLSQCGADALRFTLCSYNFKNMNINMTLDHVKHNRSFCNKIWQAFRFFSLNLPDDYIPSTNKVRTHASIIDQWILSRLHALVNTCDAEFNNCNLHLVCIALKRFWYDEFCDLYLECIKPSIKNRTASAVVSRDVMYICFDTALRALSPFMPFLTEELYQRLPGPAELRSESVMIAPYPTENRMVLQNKQLEDDLKIIQELSSAALSLRKDFKFAKTAKTDIVISSSSHSIPALVEKYRDILSIISHSRCIQVVSNDNDLTSGCATKSIDSHTDVHLVIKGFADPAVEMSKAKLRLQRLEAKLLLDNKSLEDAGDDLVQQATARQKITEVEVEIKQVRAHLAVVERLS